MLTNEHNRIEEGRGIPGEESVFAQINSTSVGCSLMIYSLHR